MTRNLLYAALLGGAFLPGACAPEPRPPIANPAGFRSSGSTTLPERPAGPAVYTPASNVTGPSGGISKRCVPQPSGIGAVCTAL